jgi:phosphoserine aminotransferase
MGSGAIKEAKFFGETVVVVSKEENYNHIPKGYSKC